jgi:hypothetical protein
MMNEELSINVTMTPSEKDGKVSDIRISLEIMNMMNIGANKQYIKVL